MDQETQQLLIALGEKLDSDRIELESSLIAHRILLQELLARQFEGQRDVFDALIEECVQAARELSEEFGRTEEVRQELAAQIAAKLVTIGQRVLGTL